jgi:hypothetical protein
MEEATLYRIVFEVVDVEATSEDEAVRLARGEVNDGSAYPVEVESREVYRL